MVPHMPTTNPNDASKPTDPREALVEPPAPVEPAVVADPTLALAAATAVTGPATQALTKTDEGFKPAAPVGQVWAPRPHSQLSPEDKPVEDLTDEELEALTQGEVSKGVVGGAFAVAAAVLGLASLTGTWLSSMIYQRENLIGGINSSGKASSVQLAAEYTDPWHKVALTNGAFAAVALVVAVVVLFTGRFLAAKELPAWVRAVAWGALAVGVISLVVSGAMYFDWLTNAIHLPPASASSSTGS